MPTSCRQARPKCSPQDRTRRDGPEPPRHPSSAAVHPHERFLRVHSLPASNRGERPTGALPQLSPHNETTFPKGHVRLQSCLRQMCLRRNTTMVPRFLIAAVCVGLGTQAALATGPACTTGCLSSCYDSEKICCPQLETKTIEKSSFEIECKDICIPAVRFPWSKCCEPRCGRVRTVRVLKKKTIKLEQCGYEWKIQGGCATGCGQCAACTKALAAPSQEPAPLPPAPAAEAFAPLEFNRR